MNLRFKRAATCNFQHCGILTSVDLDEPVQPIKLKTPNESSHEISNNVVCATSKGSDQPARMRRLIRAFATTVNLLIEQPLEFLSLKGGSTSSSESTLVKMPHCWKSHVTAQMMFGQ